ncbi:MAG: TerB family tellurite resistance protein [Gemmataceae bacterium]
MTAPMQTALALFFLLVVLTAAVSLGYLFWEFAHSAPYLWRQRVRRRLAELHARRDQLTAPGGAAGDLAAVADDLFRRHLRSVPVDALTAYPGIGPGTADRVREAGPRSLADLAGFDFRRVSGVGPARATDLRAAVRKLTAEARGRFDAGGCPEGAEYRRRVAAAQAAERDRVAATARELAGVDEAVAATEELDDLARDVTFWNHLFKSYVPGLTDEVMNRPLPAVRVPPPPPTVPVVPRVFVAPPVPTAATVPVAARAATAPAVVPPPPPPPPPQPPTEHLWLAKLRAYCEFGFLVARADGRIAQAEKTEIRRFLGERFGHDGVLVRHIDPLMERTEAARPVESAVLAAVTAVTTRAEQRELFAWAGRVADASGERNQKEKDALARLGAALDLPAASPPPTPVPLPPPPPAAPPAPDPRAVLEIEPGVELSAELVRRRFALLTDKLDPAKAGTLGPEFARLAEEKRAAVRAAAETLIARFGVPLDPPADPRHNPDLDDVFGA